MHPAKEVNGGTARQSLSLIRVFLSAPISMDQVPRQITELRATLSLSFFFAHGHDLIKTQMTDDLVTLLDIFY